MDIEVRSNSVVIKGYVNAVERDSRKISTQKGEEFVEQVRAGVWKNALEKRNDISALLNHNWDKKLGSTKDNLTLKEDNIGLYAELRSTNSDLIEKAKNKKLVGWSFGFKTNKQSWGKTDYDVERRYLDDIDLFEVSVLDDTRIPCYYGTSVESRDNEEILIERRYAEDNIQTLYIQDEKNDNNIEKRLKLVELELDL